MEQWDIYDENKQKTGRTMNRNDWHMKPDEFHLTVLGVLQRPDGKYLITRRNLDKEWAAGWWEVPGGYAFSYKRVNPEEQNNYFVDIYKYVLDFTEADVKVQPDEVTEFALASAEEIRAIAAQGIFLHYDSIRKAFV